MKDLEDIIDSCIIETINNENAHDKLKKEFEEYDKMNTQIDNNGLYNELVNTKSQLIKEIKKTNKDKENITNQNIYTEALLNRSHILSLREDYNTFDNFLKKAWKYIMSSNVGFLTIGYTLAVFHHDDFFKPFIIDIVRFIMSKVGGN